MPAVLSLSIDPSDPSYLAWIAAEAAAIRSDGCTFVGKLDGQLHEGCCYEHDLGYHYGKDARQAYVVGWDVAPAINRSTVDGRFRECNIRMSPFGRFSPIAWGRWLGVRVGGLFLWKHS